LWPQRRSPSKPSALGALGLPVRLAPPGLKLLFRQHRSSFPVHPFGPPTKCLTCRSDGRLPSHQNATLRLLSTCRSTRLASSTRRRFPRAGSSDDAFRPWRSLSARASDCEMLAPDLPTVRCHSPHCRVGRYREPSRDYPLAFATRARLDRRQRGHLRPHCGRVATATATVLSYPSRLPPQLAPRWPPDAGDAGACLVGPP
jgi:hypothetical protein